MTGCVVAGCYNVVRGYEVREKIGKMDKITRVLMLYRRLEGGETVNKLAFALENSVDVRSVDRDIQDIRLFLSEMYSSIELVFDRDSSGYRFSSGMQKELSSVEALIILKSLLGNKVLREDELATLADTVLSLIPVKEQKEIKRQFESAFISYLTPKHNKALLKVIWDLNNVVGTQVKIVINYKGANKTEKITVCPYSIEISGNFIYLVAMQIVKRKKQGVVLHIDKINSFSTKVVKYTLSEAERSELDRLILLIHSTTSHIVEGK